MNAEQDIGSGHHPLAALIERALRQEWDPHLHDCAFCREQYDEVAQLLALERSGSLDPADSSRAYRLAASTPMEAVAAFTLRRTWYLHEDGMIVRVFEDERAEALVGFVLADPALYGHISVRFSDLPEPFIPDASGRFAIGGADTDIEPMHVAIERL